MPSVTEFDITMAADAYSEIAGILAGFAFGVLGWLIQHRVSQTNDESESDERTGQAIIFLTIAFVANVVVAVLWALIAGETNKESNRPTILSLFATLNFALVAPLTVESLTFVITGTRIKRVIPSLRVAFLVSLLIGFFYLLVTTTDFFMIQDRASSITPVLEEYRYHFSFLLGGMMIILVSGWLMNKLGVNFPLRNRESNFSLFVGFWLLCVFSSTIGFGIMAVSKPESTLPIRLVLAMDLLWAILAGWAITFLPSETESTAAITSTELNTATTPAFNAQTQLSPTSPLRVEHSFPPPTFVGISAVVVAFIVGLFWPRRRWKR